MFYGWFMVLVFPIGVVEMYAWLLRSKRERLKKPVEERFEDEEVRGLWGRGGRTNDEKTITATNMNRFARRSLHITPLMFLWEPYKPKFWYWEVIETMKRLLMTEVLSTINPGTFSQLVAGLLMNILYHTVLCLVRPFNDNGDNSIAVLSTLQIIVIFVASMLMKGTGFIAEGYD